MKIEIFAKNIELDEKTEKYINSKVENLKRFLGECEKDSTCDFRIGKNTDNNKNDKIFYAECTISTPNKNYGARADEKTLTEAIDKLKDEVSKKIRRHRDKKISLVKKGGRALKKLIRR